jgi:hypothetical protein
MDSTLQWNIECSGLNGATLVNLAQIVEKSVHNGLISQLLDEELQTIYVYELCGLPVDEHSPYPNGARRLQTGSSSEIKMYSVVSAICIGCQQEIFTVTNNALKTIVENGSLTDSIQSESGGTIEAEIGPVVESSYVTVNAPVAPTRKPITSSKSGKMTKNQKSTKVKRSRA